MIWTFRGLGLDLGTPRILGILNVTPDSFSDGGRFLDPDSARHQAVRLIEEGADLLDVGGESTRPGAKPVSVDEEIRRVVPVIRLVRDLGVPVSVDTRRAPVAEAALEAGAVVVNDVSALGDPAMAPLVARSGAGLILMHMRGEPATMQEDPRYENLLEEVTAFLTDRRRKAEEAGVLREAIVLDPGIGFGKRPEHSIELLSRIDVLLGLGSPVLVGASRKSFIGAVAGGAGPEDRLPGSLAAVLAARLAGAALFRVHDVAATRQALAVFDRIAAGRAEGGFSAS